MNPDILKFFITILSKTVSLVSLIFSTYVFTTRSTPEDYGLYVLILTNISVLNIIGFQWLVLVIQKYYIHNKEIVTRLLFFTSPLIFITLGSVYYIYLHWFKSVQTPTPYLLFSILCFFILTNLSSLYFELIRSRGSQIKSSSLEIARNCIFLGFSYYIYIAPLEKLTLGDIFFIQFVPFLPIMLVAVLPVTSKRGINILSEFQIKQVVFLAHLTRFKNFIASRKIREMILYGSSMTFASVATLIMDYTDRYAIVMKFSVAELGGYFAVSAIATSIGSTLLGSVFFILLPRLARSFLKDTNTYFKTYGYGLCTSLLVSIFFLSAIIMIYPLLAYLAPNSDGLYQYAPLISSSIVVGSIKGYWIDNHAMLNHNLRYVVINRYLCAILNVLFAFMLIPYIGIAAAPLSSLLAYSIIICLSLNKTSYLDYKLLPSISLPQTVINYRPLIGALILSVLLATLIATDISQYNTLAPLAIIPVLAAILWTLRFRTKFVNLMTSASIGA